MNIVVSRELLASPTEAWHVVRDIGSTAVWNPEVPHSEALGELRHGLGARRRCRFDHAGKKWVEETVVAYDEAARSMTVRLDEGSARPPFQDVSATMTVHPAGSGCRVQMVFHVTPGSTTQRVMSWEAAPALRGVGRRILAGLDEHLSRPAHAAS